MKKVKVIIIILAVLILIGLLELLNFALTGAMMKPIAAGDLIGKYEAQLPDGGKEILNLLRNGICKQDILLKNGRTFESIGHWKYDVFHYKNDSNDVLILKDVRNSLSEFGDKINPEIEKIDKDSSTFPIKRTLFGDIKIGLYEDQDIYYRKIEN
jgi:hypothetical protein